MQRTMDHDVAGIKSKSLLKNSTISDYTDKRLDYTD